MKSIIFAPLIIIILSNFTIYPTYGNEFDDIPINIYEDIERLFNNTTFLAILQTATTIATIIFVWLLSAQLRQQRRGNDLTIRPIITIDKDSDKDPAIKLNEKEFPHIQLRLINLGSIPTGEVRAILLPLDDHSSFIKREKALKTYIKEIKEKNLTSNKSCVILEPMRIRMKTSKNDEASNKYIIVGDESKVLKLAITKYDSLLKKMENKDKINETGKLRAESLAKLNPDDWESFYHAGIKRGDLLDKMGPMDWEHFDKDSITRDDIKEILGDDAETVYNTVERRKEIVDSMSQEDRDRFNDALKNRQKLWKSFDTYTAKNILISDMKLRKAYKHAKDIFVRKLTLLAPQHPIYLTIDLEDFDKKKIDKNDYMYFGVLVQYGKLNGKKYEFVYYLQGYFRNKIGHIDYALDFLDT